MHITAIVHPFPPGSLTRAAHLLSSKPFYRSLGFYGKTGQDENGAPEKHETRLAQLIQTLV